MLTVTTSAGTVCAVVNVALEGQATASDHQALRSIGTYAQAFRQANWRSTQNPGRPTEPYVPHVGARTIVTLNGQEHQVAAVVQHIINNRGGRFPEVDQ